MSRKAFVEGEEAGSCVGDSRRRRGGFVLVPLGAVLNTEMGCGFCEGCWELSTDVVRDYRVGGRG